MYVPSLHHINVRHLSEITESVFSAEARGFLARGMDQGHVLQVW
jgi:hypothetical protein